MLLKNAVIDLVEKPLKLELKLTISIEHVTELSILLERTIFGAVDKFGVAGINI